jgi:hypothetical protein
MKEKGSPQPQEKSVFEKLKTGIRQENLVWEPEHRRTANDAAKPRAEQRPLLKRRRRGHLIEPAEDPLAGWTGRRRR